MDEQKKVSEKQISDNAIKTVSRLIRFCVASGFAVTAFMFWKLGARIEDQASSAIHQILSAVYYCCGFLSTICAIVIGRK